MDDICKGYKIKNTEYKPDLKNLDLFELYTMIKYKKMEYLYVDAAMGHFTAYKDNGWLIDDIFSTIIGSINSTIYILSVDATKQDNQPVEIQSFPQGFSTNDVKIQLKEKDCVYVEYDEKYFGHFGVFYLNNERLYFFDSMMYTTTKEDEKIHYYDNIYYIYNEDSNEILNNSNNISPLPKTYICSKYFNDFYNKLRENFEISNYNVYFDFPNIHENDYSMEITGGAFIENEFMANIEKTNKDKSTIENNIKKYILGPDNQNQFCYMWAIFYIFVQYFSDKKFTDIIRDIHSKDIIPIFIIKRFLFLVIFKLDVKREKIIRRNRKNVKIIEKFNILDSIKRVDVNSYIFQKYFRYVLCNSAKHSEIYDNNRNDYDLYDVLINDLELSTNSMAINDRLALVVPPANTFSKIVYTEDHEDMCDVLGINSELLNKLMKRIENHIRDDSYKFIEYLVDRSNALGNENNSIQYIKILSNLNKGSKLTLKEVKKSKRRRSYF